jgi:transcriptional regulator with GAF, ATPase, and Fis domain
MEQDAHLLLELWREVSRHLEIGESIERIAALLATRLPVELVLVRQLDTVAQHLDTIAVGQCRPGPLPRSNRNALAPVAFQQLLDWTRRGQTSRLDPASDAPILRGLLPHDLEGRFLASPLDGDHGNPGVLIVATSDPAGFQPAHQDLLHSLREPFITALANTRRLGELRSLREAVEADNRALLSKLGRHDISDTIIGAQTGLRSVMEYVDKVARSDAPVLILGETGSGKEVVARAIHSRSRRVRGPFLRVNCGAIPPELIDSELFGHEKGSFTGALRERRGWFERASGGTLFLDECGELAPAVQVRLLLVLQDGIIERVGGERPVHVDVRIVAATHRDLESMVATGQFRQDLWYRIAVFPIRLPPLRERVADIPAMASHFAARACARLGMPPLEPSSHDVQRLCDYPWPGNVRELAAVIERAAILGNGECLDVADALGSPTSSARLATVGTPHIAPAIETANAPLESTMARHIEAALAQTRGRVDGPFGAAALLQIHPQTLRSRMRKLKIDWRQFRNRS